MLHAHAWLKSSWIVCPNIFSFHLLFRAMSHALHCTPSILSSISLSSTSPSFTSWGSGLITSRIHCTDSRDLRGDGFTDPELRTGSEPKKTVDNPIVTEQEIEHSAGESQNPEIEDKGFRIELRPVLCTIKPVTVVFDSRFYWKPCYASRSRLGRRTNSCSAGFTTVFTGARSKFGTIASLSLWNRWHDLQFISKSELHGHRETCGMALSHQKRLGQDGFSEREQPADVLGSDESIFRFSNPAYVAKSLLDWNRDHLLTQARSELMKQEHKVESLNHCMHELQQQAYAKQMDLENAHHGYVEFWREQVRLQEELVMKKKLFEKLKFEKCTRWEKWR